MAMYRFQNWGQAVPHRPVEDNAFAVARFFQRGGSFHNYYMVGSNVAPSEKPSRLLEFILFFSLRYSDA